MAYRNRVNTFWNQSGLGIMEVLVASGILGIVAIGFGSFIANSNKQQRTAENRITAASLQAEVTSLLADPIACANSLKGYKPSESPKNLILKSEHNAEVYKPDSLISNSHLKILDITLTPDATLPTKFANINVSVNASEGEMVMRSRVIRLGITVNSSDAIEACSSISSFISEDAIAEAVKKTLASLPACPTDHLIKSFDSNGAPVCVKVVNTSAPSPCGGTLVYGTTVRTTTATDAVYFGLTCGKASGDANKCHSCRAEWVYDKNPATQPGPYTVQCQCR